MADRGQARKTTDVVQGAPPERFITVPARARDEIGELAYYLERTLRNLREVNDHLRGSSQTMPGVLHELRDIVQMTEAATVRVLEETEALVDEGRTAAALIDEARREAKAGSVEGVSQPLAKVQALVDMSNNRAMAIMSALEFQDLTSQKVQRAFNVLEEVVVRLAKIQTLVDLGEEVGPKPGQAPVASVEPRDAKSGQDLADELLLGFER
jgi:chemotaxis regulatin CheY-phosphate phosphatase CheZ